MFGRIGKDTLKVLAERDFEKGPLANTPTKIFHLYWKYVKAWEHRLGKEATNVMEHQVRKEIESMDCVNCPVYQNILNRNGSSDVVSE